jgi:hypothetical protein
LGLVALAALGLAAAFLGLAAAAGSLKESPTLMSFFFSSPFFRLMLI